MLLAALLAKPLWQVIPAYFIIGVVWALAYLPRSITLQARAYRAWRDRYTSGTSLGEFFRNGGRQNPPAPETFQRRRDAHRFTERHILIGFMVNIAFWPLRMVEKLLFDILRSTFVWVFEVLCDAWNKLLVPFFRAIGRLLRAVGRCIRSFFNWIGRAIDFIWDSMVVPVWRAVHRCVRAVWYDVLVPMYTWTYRYVTTAYKSIIQRANREAIADLAALNNTTAKDVAK